MKLFTKITFCIAFLSPVLGSAKELTSQPAGIRISMPPHNGEDKMRSFNHSPGTNLCFTITSKQNGAFITDVDFSKSVITAAVDDTGKNLITADTKKQRDINSRTKLWSAAPTIAADNHAILLQTSIFPPFALPSTKAASINLKAQVTLLTATDNAQSSSIFNAQLGEITAFKDYKIEIIKIDPKGGFSNTPYKLVFKAYCPAGTVKHVDFIKADQSVIKQHHVIQFRKGSSEKSEWINFDILLAEAPPKDTQIRISSWSGTQETVVPVDLTFTLGLDKN